MVIRINVEDLIKDTKIALVEKRRLVNLIVGKEFDIATQPHPIESYLADAGIPYHFNGDGVGKKTDYVMDLTQMEIVY